MAMGMIACFMPCKKWVKKETKRKEKGSNNTLLPQYTNGGPNKQVDDKDRRF